MAQTGTGKTAAFALPVLADIDLSSNQVQALVLCPTRELAIQVAEAFQTYASGMPGFHVLPLYGGQDMRLQLRGLKRGAHVIVGTPGRVLDHLRRKSLNLSAIHSLVLDEADEMLRMGFIDDVETILEQTPENKRVALFSATMPKPVRKVAERYLRDPEEVKIKTKATTNENIEQSYWLVSGTNKLDALTRILEVESFDGMIIFVRTKTSTAELAERINARGFSAAALNGDMNQSLRSATVDQLKNGKLDILVATDVAARGLDVERISHVINYDIPYDEEAYVHRIGRTGRAGRSGKAILFVAPRERRMLKSIERATNKKITRMDLPSRAQLIDTRAKAFKEQIKVALEQPDLSFFNQLVDELCDEQDQTPNQVAAAMAYLLQKDRPILPPKEREASKTKDSEIKKTKTADRNDDLETQPQPLKRHPEIAMERFVVQVGRADDVKPGEIVGAIANEAEISGDYIGSIQIHNGLSTIDLPEGMPPEIFRLLKKVRVRNKELRIQRIDDYLKQPVSAARPRPKKKKRSANGKRFHKQPSSERHGSYRAMG